MRFISPRTDFAFKKIFGSSQSKPILISFLNALLYGGNPVIQDLTILDPYQAPQVKGIKDSFLDVKVTTADNETIIIEMQVLNVLGFKKRVLYNAAKAFSIQLEIGQGYTTLNPVIALTITNFEMFPGRSQIISHYGLQERDDHSLYSDDLQLVFVELPKFKKSLDQLETITDQWLYFLREADSLETVPEVLQRSPPLQQALEIAETSNLSPEEYDLLQRQSFFVFDQQNAIAKAQQETRQETTLEVKRELARSLLDVLEVGTIAEKTGLTIEEINQLAN
jgi:predicted transposase/invertase (TIGR01784 family)